MFESNFLGLTVEMASPGDDMSKFDQFELYQQAEEQFDNELSPDRWGPGYMFTEDK